MKTKRDLKKQVLITVLKTDQLYVEIKEQLKELEAKSGYNYNIRNLLNDQLGRLEELIGLNDDLIDNCLKEES